MSIKDWLLNFLKSKGSFEMEEFSIEDKDKEIILKKESSEKRFLVKDELEDSILDYIKKHEGDLIVVVTLNKKVNVDWLVKNWQELIKFPKLSFMFVNPDTSEKWALFPKTHDLITEKASLKKGVVALFESIQKVG